jgi:ATP-binding cassette subfamily F protein uup
MALINIQNITLGFGGSPLFDGLDLQIHRGEKIALLGRNGAGKSTLMKLINGEAEPDAGMVVRDRGLSTSLLAQQVPDDVSGSAYSVIAGGIAHPDLLRHHMDSHEEMKARRQTERALSLLGLDGDEIFETMSAGMKRRVLLGRALACEPDILLLDEPTNHLDIDSITWLEDFLARYGKTVLFVTHDRAFMQKIADRIIELDRGRLFDWKCDYQTFLARKDAWLDSEEAQNRLFDKKLSREEEWIRKGIKARRTRNEGRVRALKKMREERAARREVQGSVRMELQRAEDSGKMVIEVDDITFGYAETKLVDSFSARILRGDRIGIIGPNGCGKSTLIKLLLGEIAPESGSVKSGARLETAYFDQLRSILDGEKTVRQNVTDGNDIIDFNGKSRHVIGYLQDFLFPPDRVDVKVGVLSGGERNRLLLAKLLTRPANLLVLDEPTNDLDVETIELLEEMLLEYRGTLLLVSHDRAFLNNVVTSTYVFEGGGVVREYAGGYDDWLVQRKPAAREVREKRPERPKKQSAKTKLTFREKQELESLPAEIEAKESRIREIYSTMADPAFYRREGAGVTGVTDELHALERQVESLYLRWDELSSFEGGE